MQELSDKGDPIDPVSVKSALDSIGQFEQVGGMAFLASLINAVPKMCIRDRPMVVDKYAGRCLDVGSTPTGSIYSF